MKKHQTGGGIDGYPIVVFNNGAFLGLYTLNIPKDEWMFAMDDKKTPDAAILMADNWNEPVYLSTFITNISEDSTEGFVSEFYGKNLSDDAIIDSFNSFILNLQSIASKEDLDATLGRNTIERAIDSMILSIISCAADNTAKNILWGTYDGVTWFPSVYDLDGTWGLQWSGLRYYNPTEVVIPSENLGNLLWQVIYKYDFEELQERYKELRNSILSYDNILSEFEYFFSTIPNEIRKAEQFRWSEVPSQNTNNFLQIQNFTKERLEFVDSFF